VVQFPLIIIIIIIIRYTVAYAPQHGDGNYCRGSMRHFSRCGWYVDLRHMGHA